MSLITETNKNKNKYSTSPKMILLGEKEISSLIYHDIFDYPLAPLELINWTAGKKIKFKNLEKKIPCSYALIFNPVNTKVLLIKHHDSDKYSLPGGKIEVGEGFDVCLVRELEEEIGVRVEINHDVINTFNAHINKRNFRAYIIRLDEREYKTKSPFEISTVEWVDIDKINIIPKTKLLNCVIRRYYNSREG